MLEQIAHMLNIHPSGTRDMGMGELSRRLGINGSTLQKYIRGEVDVLRIRDDIFNKIADARKVQSLTLRQFLETGKEEIRGNGDLGKQFIEMCTFVPIQNVPEGIMILAQRLMNSEELVNPPEVVTEDLEVPHQGNQRLWQLVEEKMSEFEEQHEYPPGEGYGDFVAYANVFLRGEAEQVFADLKESGQPIENKYLTGGLRQLLGKPPSELIEIRDGLKKRSTTDA